MESSDPSCDSFCFSAHIVPQLDDQAPLEPDWTDKKDQSLSLDVSPNHLTEFDSNMEEPGKPATPQNSLGSHDLFTEPTLVPDNEIFDLSYEPISQSSFDPYGFKLSPEHSSHTLLDPDEAELSPELTGQDLTFDPEPSGSAPGQLNFDTYEFDISPSQMVRDSDPYGFKLSPEEENQEILELSGHDHQEAMDLCSFDNKEHVESFNFTNQEVLEPFKQENQEVPEHCSNNNHGLLDLCGNGNQEVLENPSLGNTEVDVLVCNDNQELLDLDDCHDNQEVVEPYHFISNKTLEPCNYDNQEVLEPCRRDNLKLLEFSFPENQEVLDSHGNREQVDCGSEENQEIGSRDNQELLDFGNNEKKEFPDLGCHDNQEVLEVFSEANNNQCVLEPEVHVSPTNHSSDSDVASEDLLGLELSYSRICPADTINTNDPGTLMTAVSNTSAHQPFTASSDASLLEGDLSSVFGAGGYIGCPDVADDLEPLDRRQVNTVPEPVRPVRPVRPPRPSLRVSWTI